MAIWIGYGRIEDLPKDKCTFIQKYVESRTMSHGMESQTIYLMACVIGGNGTEVHYWRMVAGRNMKIGGNVLDEENGRQIDAASDNALRIVKMWLYGRDQLPMPGLLAREKDLVLLDGQPPEFMRWDHDRKTWVEVADGIS